MTNNELIRAIRAGNPDNRLLMELWNQNIGIVHKVCNKYRQYIEPEDAEQECFIAFLDAVSDYSEHSGHTFLTYMQNRMRWHLIRQIENTGGLIRIPVQQRALINKYLRFCRKYYQEHGEQPNDRQLCQYLGLTPKRLRKLQNDLYAVDIQSLDSPLPSDPEVTEGDLVLDPRADTQAAAMDPVFIRERRRAVRSAVDQLPEENGQAIRLYYFGGLTYEQAGEVTGTHTNTIRQRIEKGLWKLRTGKRFKILQEFIEPDYIYSKAVRGTGVGTFNRTRTSSTEYWALQELEYQRKQQKLEEMGARIHRELEESRKKRQEMPIA